MRLFPMDWQEFLEDSVHWGQLSIPARKTFLHGARPGLRIVPDSEDPSVSELGDTGFLEEEANGLTVSPKYARFHRLAKALERIPIFETPGFDVLREYLIEHFTRAERSLLHASFAFHPDDFSRIASLITTTEWLEEFLSRRGAGGQTAALDGARRILRFFMEQRDHVPLKDMEEYFPGLGRQALPSALKLGVQSAVFFLSLRRSDLEPLVGIWPSTARRLRSAAIALPPEAVATRDRFLCPFLLEDMATVLLSARVEPIPIRRTDEKPFSRFEEEQAESLLSLPAWLEEFTGATPRIRVRSALTALRMAWLIEAVPGEETLTYHPTEKAKGWSLSPASARLDGFLQNAALPAGSASRPSILLSLLLGSWSAWAEAAADVLPSLIRAFSSSPRASFIRFRDFARYQVAVENPLITLRERGGGASLLMGLSPFPTDELLEDLWQSFLHAYLSFGLLALGGAEAGSSEEGQTCFHLTQLGRYLLGLEEAFDAPAIAAARENDPEAGTERKNIVVQPTFEVAFLSASPEAEAMIARFAQRAGREVGVLFRITKERVIRGAESGLDTETILGSLRRFSRNPVPANVEHEIRAWLSPQSQAEMLF
jgi:hypothetical protein